MGDHSPPVQDEDEPAASDTKADDELSTVDSASDAASVASSGPWCPPKPRGSDDPSEEELSAAADKIETMVIAAKRATDQGERDFFLLPRSLGGLPHIWLQAKLTIPLNDLRKRYASTLSAVAAEMWLRGERQNILGALLCHPYHGQTR